MSPLKKYIKTTSKKLQSSKFKNFDDEYWHSYKYFFPALIEVWCRLYLQVTNDKGFWELRELLAPSNQYHPEYLYLSSKYCQMNQGNYLDVFGDKP